MKTSNSSIPVNYATLGAECYNHILTINNCTVLGFGDEKVKSIIQSMKTEKIDYMGIKKLKHIK